MVSVYLTLLIINILFSSGCASYGIPEFPAEYTFVVKQDLKQCSRHKIISYDPIKVDKGEFIQWENCPDVFGFSSQDAGKVFNWIRNLQKVSKERCQ
jgi:hypothetical protein